MPIKLLFRKNRAFYWHFFSVTGIVPGNFRLYELAFIHKSASVSLPDGSLINNERLEFLGDAILDAVIADFLFKRYSDRREGFLTQMRSKIVKRNHLDKLATRMGLDRLIISHTMKCTNKKHLYGNAFEAMVGAMYLDKGYRCTSRYVVNNVIKKFVNLKELEFTETDFKSRLIEWGQKSKQSISFEIHEEYSNTEKLPIFISYAWVSERNLGTGEGKSKKEAEQRAAEQALTIVNNNFDSFFSSIEQTLD